MKANELVEKFYRSTPFNTDAIMLLDAADAAVHYVGMFVLGELVRGNNFHERDLIATSLEEGLKKYHDYHERQNPNRSFTEKQKKEQELAERKACAEKVEVARKAYLEAQKAYKKELEAFCGKYGTYHYSTTSAEEIPSLFDWFNNLFKL